MNGSYSDACRMLAPKPQFHEPIGRATAIPPVIPSPVPNPEMGNVRKSLPMRVAAANWSEFTVADPVGRFNPAVNTRKSSPNV